MRQGALQGRARRPGSGKSHFFAELWLDENVREKLDYVCVREVQKSLTFSVKKLLEHKIEALQRRGLLRRAGQEDHLALGGVTIFEGMQDHTADSIKSLEDFDRAWVEEAQRLSPALARLLRARRCASRAPSCGSLEPDQRPTRSTRCCAATSRRLGGGGAANYRDNPWLAEELRDELEYDQKRDPDKFAHIWLGEYQRNSEARVFKNWKIEEFEVDPAAVKRQGADWGFSIDPTVLVQCYIVGRKLYVPYEAYMVGCEITDTPALFMTVPEAEKWPITADSARPETISHMRKNGFPKIMPAVKGPRSVEEGIEFLKSFDIIVHPRCVHRSTS
jgi:phage terminase large subunit